jgi:UDP-2-acetamido-3-amino-2,3-dideoxy-glucuronate N-acetyltransferase
MVTKIISPGAVVGKDCVIHDFVIIHDGAVVGDRCKIQNFVALYKGVILKEDVFIGPSVVFTNVTNPRAFINRKSEFKTTLVKKGASIGANATIVCGVTIGEYAAVAAGSVVTDDIPDFALVKGNPARIYKEVSKEFDL